MWQSLANEYVRSLQLDWQKVIQFAFNDKCNPDDDALGAQIVKVSYRGQGGVSQREWGYPSESGVIPVKVGVSQ